MQVKDQLLDIDGIKSSKKSIQDLFIRRTAVLTSTPEWLTEKIIKDQWENANKMTREGSSIAEIDFPNIGTIYISKAKSRKRIKRLSEANQRYILNIEDPNDKYKLDRNIKDIADIKLKAKLEENEV
jgi:hypothetical protein